MTWRYHFAVLLVVLLAVAVGAETYRWRDEDGILHFSDTPPPEQDAAGSAPPGEVPTLEPKAPSAEQGLPPGLPTAPRVDFELAGSIMDPEGHPIDNVAVIVVERHHDPQTFDFKDVKREYRARANGTFTVSCRDCPVHFLEFAAPGFRWKRIPIKPSKEQEKAIMRRYAAAFQGQDVPGGTITVVQKGIEVILQPAPTDRAGMLPAGRPPDLLRSEGPLLLTRQGPVNILAGTPPRMAPSIFKAIMDQGMAEDGTTASPVMLMLAIVPTAGGDRNRYPLGDTVCLKLTLAEGGFIDATPEEIVGTYKMLRTMEVAPASGYQPCLRLGLDQPRDIYFYCKIGKFYGKGWTTIPMLRGREALQSGVGIYLNPAGGRDLRGRL